MSFGNDELDDDSELSAPKARAMPKVSEINRDESPLTANEDDSLPVKRKLAANASVGHVPKSMTKNALLQEAQVKEQLRKEFLAMQEAVKATEFLVPFVFYDGSNIPGGVCRMKKGDMIWLFLDRARKVGAELGVGGSEKSKREWARVGVDDLMIVRGDLIIPHVRSLAVA